MKNIKSTVLKSSIIFLSAMFSAGTVHAQCRAACGSNASVSVDLNGKCMCVKGNCFLVSIGTQGPTMTAGGAGRLGNAQGDKFQTKPGLGSSGYDNDAIAMGIPSNDNVGKWIHKTSGCAPGGSNATKGCIAVPCEKWSEVKKEMGQSLMVCGGSSGHGSSGQGSQGTGGQR